ncbi:transcriptional regulator [Streptomyces sp. T-3]|nr:transcriptional regulator [Streptomyces sp. T-3]
MARTAQQVLHTISAELAPAAAGNRLVPLISAGEADREALSALALEQRHIIASDRRAFARLAERATAQDRPAAAAFFSGLVEGETVAARHLEALTAACGLDGSTVTGYEPRPGCQAYPSYVAWLALNSDPAGAVLALTANFATWGGYCAAIATGLRTHYSFSGEACAFFDFFAQPAPDLDKQAVAAVQEGLDDGHLDEAAALRHGRLLQSYEALFWDTLAELA